MHIFPFCRLLLCFLHCDLCSENSLHLLTLALMTDLYEFMVRSLMHLELSFLKGESKESNYIILYIGIVCSTSYIENPPFCRTYCWPFCKKLGDHKSMGLYMDPSFITLTNVSVFFFQYWVAVFLSITLQYNLESESSEEWGSCNVPFLFRRYL